MTTRQLKALAACGGGIIELAICFTRDCSFDAFRDLQRKRRRDLDGIEDLLEVQQQREVPDSASDDVSTCFRSAAAA